MRWLALGLTSGSAHPTALPRDEQYSAAQQRMRSWAAGGLAHILIETNTTNSICSQGGTKIDPKRDSDPPTTTLSKKEKKKRKWRKNKVSDEISDNFHNFPLPSQLFSTFTNLYHTHIQKQECQQLSSLLPFLWSFLWVPQFPSHELFYSYKIQKQLNVVFLGQ